MATELFRCHIIANAFKLDPHEIYEKWDVKEVAETYSFLTWKEEQKEKHMKENEKKKKSRYGRRRY